MSWFSISCSKPGRVPQPETLFRLGANETDPDESVQILIDSHAYGSQLEMWADIERLIMRMRELGHPRPGLGEIITGEPWSDGTFWTDGTGWI